MLVKNDVECQYCYKIPHTGRSRINSIFFHSVNFRLFIVLREEKRKMTGDFYKNEYNKDYQMRSPSLFSHVSLFVSRTSYLSLYSFTSKTI